MQIVHYIGPMCVCMRLFFVLAASRAIPSGSSLFVTARPSACFAKRTFFCRLLTSRISREFRPVKRIALSQCSYAKLSFGKLNAAPRVSRPTHHDHSGLTFFKAREPSDDVPFCIAPVTWITENEDYPSVPRLLSSAKRNRNKLGTNSDDEGPRGRVLSDDARL